MHTPLDRADSPSLAASIAPDTIAGARRAVRDPHAGPRRFRWLIARGVGFTVGLALLWAAASAFEWATGRRVLPSDPYASCGATQPAELPQTVRVGLYEEFPAPWRLERLRYVDFPVDLAVAAPSRTEFLAVREMIRATFPQVREVYFWPLLKQEEGYYPGTWSNAGGVQRAAREAEGLPTLWDLEMPPGLKHPSVASWPQNRAFIDQWLRARQQPVHIWRSHASMGLDPLFLRLAGMHFDPLDYPNVSLHLDLYEKGDGMPAAQMARILRCGVERYGPRFIPALGVLDDGHATSDQFIRFETLRRDIQLARQAGVSELWLFGVNGLTPSVARMLHETLPLE
jgi:hypothetical protein